MPVSHQTVKLSRGKHRSPDEGACVMELASMLAGEHFTDHPRSVCPVIAGFVRAYNDSVDDRHRQDLYGYASKLVGSLSPLGSVQYARAARLDAWASERTARRGRSLLRYISALDSSLRVRPHPLEAGTRAVRAIGRHTDETHAAALALIDELLEIGDAGPSGGEGNGEFSGSRDRATWALLRSRHVCT